MTTVVIDDSGSPGSSIESQFLKNTRKTWVAVLINDNKLMQVKADLNYINTLLKQCNIDELHFTDLVNGNEQYSIFDQKERLSIFETLCMFYKEYQFPFFVQTTNPETLAENGLVIKAKKIKYGGLNCADYKDQGLLLLFLKIADYLQQNNRASEDIDFIIDEDSKNKPGKKLNIPLLEKINKSWIPRFEESSKENVLQIADFVAYCINRFQTTMVKNPKNRTDYDKIILSLMSEALEHSGVSGVKCATFDINNVTRDDYDYEQIKQRQKDGTIGKYWGWRKVKGDII